MTSLRSRQADQTREQAFRASLQRQVEAKRLTMELDRRHQEQLLETSRNFLLQEQDKEK